MKPKPAFRPSDNPSEFMDKVKALFDQGLTYNEIAQAIGSKRSTIAAFCRDNLVNANDHRNIFHNLKKAEERTRRPNGKSFEVLRSVQAWTKANGFSPTYRQIADSNNLSVAGAFYHIRQLADNGFLVKSGVRARTITLTAAGQAAANEKP